MPTGSTCAAGCPSSPGLPDEHLAEPWLAPADVQEAAGCVIGSDYPEPLVDLDDSRREAIAHFQRARG